MSKFAVNYLAVFFNVFSQIGTMFRGFMSDVIKAYLTITSPEDINSTFKKVLAMLSQALESNESAPTSNDPSTAPPMSHTMLDLSIIMIPFLDAESCELLYNGTIQSLLNKEDEPTLQKKGYKILKHLMSHANGQQVIAHHLQELQQRLLDATATCTISAKKDRIKVLSGVVSALPNTDYHFIPAILSEVVLASKDNNEKTRTFAFDLLVSMGQKMKEGGVIKSSQLEGFDESVPDTQATIQEYFTMLTAGLADAYEEVLYGSDSEIDDDSDDETVQKVKAAVETLKQQKKKKNKQLQQQAFIREDEDSPLDFLDRSALGHISSSKPVQRKKKNIASAFNENEDGRLIISEPTANAQNTGNDDEDTEDYYMQHVTNPDGFVRDKRNRIKFKKGKDAQEDAMELDDDEESGASKKKKPSQKYEKIGKEFRSKKAGGDVKRKGQMDPYAYMPLTKVIKKRGRHDQKVTFTGRVKK
ncbi:hypothetical protein RMATCC62417_16418 [Rhizopus microsporus]|nr:hypothetical protein RMATCC62417_16418 [Rhizopus microsporus]